MTARLVGVVFLSAVLLGQVKRPEPLTVCEVLSRLSFYRGQGITVRGELRRGDEGRALSGEGCRSLITDGYHWSSPSAIALTYSESSGVQDSKSETQTVKLEHVDPNLLKAAGRGDKIYVTVTGQLETRVHFEMVLRGDGKVVPYGYGHLNACPAQLVYHEMKEVEVVPAKH